MARLILDTNALIQLDRHGERVTGISESDDIAIAAVTLAELRHGALAADTSRRQAREQFIQDVEETIRFYQRKGLLAEPERPFGGVRLYGADDVARVKFVKSAQRLGFNLDEVAQLLRLDDGTVWMSQKQLADLYQVKVPTINAHLKNLFQVIAFHRKF